jgi:DNA repair photolyase
MAKVRVVAGQELTLDYISPRISSEVYECGLPLTFDQYNRCGFNCAYCFAAFVAIGHAHSKAKIQGGDAALASKYVQPVRGVDPDRFIRYWSGAPSAKWRKVDAMMINLIRQRAVLHWGGLSDPFCPFEERFRLGYELLTFLRGLDWPVTFSTKGTLMTREPWASMLAGGNFRFQFSITTEDFERSRFSEEGTPSPDERFEAMRTVTRDMGCRAILRFRPIIPGYVTPEECVHMIERAAAAGAESVSTEFFCLERRADPAKYALLSQPIGFDLLQFYIANSPGQAGYLRLSRPYKEQFFLPMARAAHKLGLRFSVSDKHFKELGTCDACCGAYARDDASAYINRGTLTYALIFARRHGVVHWSDVGCHLDWADELMSADIQGLMSSSLHRSRHRRQTLKDALRTWWNTPNASKSPYQYSGGKVVPDGIDENGDVVYRYVDAPYDAEVRALDPTTEPERP